MCSHPTSEHTYLESKIHVSRAQSSIEWPTDVDPVPIDPQLAFNIRIGQLHVIRVVFVVVL